MTRHQEYIGILGQLLFYAKYYFGSGMLVLYVGCDKHKRPIAYGLISYDHNLQPWITGGILPGFRGAGYGKQLFSFLSNEWHFPVYLEVLESNQPARNLYTSLGFIETQRETRVQGTVITMKKGA